MDKLTTFSTDHKNYKNAAILLDNKTVVVDFDDADSVKVGNLIFNQFPTLKVHTRRGFHLYYRKPKGVYLKNWVGKLTNSGVVVDYKHTTKQPIIVKQNNTMRKMDNGNLLGEWESLPELPFHLWPNKLSEVLYGLKDGQGRNSKLYSHLLTTKEMYKQDVKDLATFINNRVFGEPLKERELENILGSVNSKNIEDAPNKFLNKKDMIMTSEVLVEKLDIKFYQGKFYFKQNDRYLSDNNLLFRAIDELIKLKPNQMKELEKLFEIKAERIEQDDFHIQLRNGYIIDNGEVIQVDAGFTPYYLDIKYDPTTTNKDIDNFFDFLTCDRKDLRLVLEEMFGHMLMTKNFPHKVFFFQGSEGGNGKSTLIKMIKNFIGDTYTAVPLDKFDDDTSAYSLVGKLVNIGDDIDASYLDRSSNFKTIASGDPVMLRPIYSPPVELNNKATLIFTCNEMPVFKDKSGGIERRMVVIPCENVVKTIDNEIDEKLSSDEAKSYLLNLALSGIERIRKNGSKISDSITIQQKTKEYFIESDSVAAFIDEYSEKILGKEPKRVHRQYVAYCVSQGLKEVGIREFGRRLSKIGYRSIPKKKNGEMIRVYQKVTN